MSKLNKSKKNKSKSKKKTSKSKSNAKTSKGNFTKKRQTKTKTSKRRQTKKILSKRESPLNSIVFTVTERKPNPNQNNILHQRLIPNSPLSQLESLLMGYPEKTYNNTNDEIKKKSKSKKLSQTKQQYPTYLNDLFEKSRQSQTHQQSHRLSPNIFMPLSDNYSTNPYQQHVIQQPIIRQPENYKRVETSTFTSQNVNGNVSKSGVKVVSDSRNPKSHLFTLQDGNLTHEMVNHSKVNDRVKKATKKMNLLKKKQGHSIKSSKSSKSGKSSKSKKFKLKKSKK